MAHWTGRRHFYLAGSWRWREACRALADSIAARSGAVCTSRWLTSDEDDTDPAARRIGAGQCINDVRRSDCLLVVLGDRDSLGKHVEVGAALALYRPVVMLVAPWATEPVVRNDKCAFYELCAGPYPANAPLAVLDECW